MRYVITSILIVCVINAHAQNTIVFKGNVIGMSPASTATAIDPVTGKAEKEPLTPQPVTLNGERIYNSHALTTLPSCTGADGQATKLSVYLFNALKKEFEKLEDGKYVIAMQNPVIDKHGHLAYYSFDGVKKLNFIPERTTAKNSVIYTRVHTKASDKEITASLRKTINARAQHILEQLPFMTPGKIKDSPVNCTGDIFGSGNFIIVKGHRASFTPGYFDL